MKKNKIVLLLIFCCVWVYAFPQSKSYTVPKQLRLEMGCGLAGISSYEFYEIAKIINDKRFEVLKPLLNDTSFTIQLLSAFAIEYLTHKKKLILTEDESKSITRIKQANTKVSICIGCTGHFNCSVQSLFNGLTKKKKGNLAEFVKNNLGL